MSLSEYNYTVTSKKASEPWSATEYKTLHVGGTGSGTFARDNSQATVSYICEYYHHEQFLDVVLGKTVKSGSSLKRSASSPTFTSTQGSTPEEHPYYYNFFASTAQVEPLGKPDTDPLFDNYTYPKAKVTVVFRPPTFNILADGSVSSEALRYVTKSPEGQGDILTVPNQMFFWVSRRDQGKTIPLDITPGFTVASQRVTYTWHQIPVATRSDGKPDLGRVPNISTIQALMGSVNSYTFDSYAPGTVLLVTWSAKLVLPQCASANNYYWDISYVFSVRDYGSSPLDFPPVPGEHIGHNYAFDPSPLANRWDLYTTDGTRTGKTLYPYADLNQLFAVSW